MAGCRGRSAVGSAGRISACVPGAGRCVMRSRSAEAGTVAQTDGRGVTEFGAEGVALALAALAQDWVVLRRLQQGEFGDWLLHDADGETVALEVSGVAMSDDEGRMSEKLRQVAGAETVVKAACIVAFGPPKAALDVVGRR